MRTLLLCGVLAFLVSPQAGAQALRDSNLPIVLLETDGQEIPNEPKIDARMRIVYRGDGERTALSDAGTPEFLVYDGKIGIERRGQSSNDIFPKLQYALETREEDRSNRNVGLLGLPSENDWILNGPYSDKSLMRNALAYDLARATGQYAPRTRFVEVLLNNNYIGVYLLIERIKRDANRVDIARLRPEEIADEPLSGGYIFRIDKDASSENSFRSIQDVNGRSIRYQYFEPSAREIQPEQKTYLQNFVGAFERMMAQADYANPTDGYPQWLDLSTFVDYVIVNELARNVDAYRLSTYLHKDRDRNGGKLRAGPVWDFNLGFQNVNYAAGDQIEGWHLPRGPGAGDFFQTPFWWAPLFQDPNFQTLFAGRWRALRAGSFALDSLYARVDAYAANLEEAQTRNFQRWNVLGQYVWPNADGSQLRTTYQSEVEFLRNWLRARSQWMDFSVGATACASGVVISEIQYNPADSTAGGDWIELHNPTDEPISLAGWTLRDGNTPVAYSFPNTPEIAPGGFLVLAENLERFAQAFPDGPSPDDQLPFGLNNGGELITLYDAEQCLTSHIWYDDEAPWAVEADGQGATLVLTDPMADPALPFNWQPSETENGTPGAANSQAAVPIEAFSVDVSDRSVSLTWDLTDPAWAVVVELATEASAFRPVGEPLPGLTQATLADLTVGTYRVRLRAQQPDASVRYSNVLEFEIVDSGSALRLSPPYPNPTASGARVSVSSNTGSRTRLVLYDPLGRSVRVVFDEVLEIGRSEEIDIPTAGLASGVYLLRLEATTETVSRRLVVR